MSSATEKPDVRTLPAQAVPAVARNRAVSFIAPFALVKGIFGKYKAPKRPNRSRPNPVSGVGSDEAEAWAELEKEELSSARIDAIAAHLRATGQASK